jgi:hypothetical protein
MRQMRRKMQIVFQDCPSSFEFFRKDLNGPPALANGNHLPCRQFNKIGPLEKSASLTLRFRGSARAGGQADAFIQVDYPPPAAY